MTTGTDGDVRFPAMRDEVRYAVTALADETYQESFWTSGARPRDDYFYDFDSACHAILDDTALLTDPSSMLGEVVVTQEELDRLIDLSRRLIEVISEIGRAGSYEDARRSRQWSEVIESATMASDLIGRPEVFP